jgi:hypothetical protein
VAGSAAAPRGTLAVVRPRSILALAVIAIGVAIPGSALAQPPPPTTVPPGEVPPDQESGVSGGGAGGDQPPVTLPLVPVPEGCTPPPSPHVVFVGRVEERDYRSIRFEIEQIRAGDPAPFATGNVIDIRYGLDAQYLDDGERYLVSALVDPDLGFLVSRVTPLVENFGGDEVIGVSESDVSCPVYDDPMRTLHLDGSPVEAELLQPLFGARIRMLGAVLVPLAVAVGAVFLLATFRLSLSGLYNSLTGARRRA